MDEFFRHLGAGVPHQHGCPKMASDHRPLNSKFAACLRMFSRCRSRPWSAKFSVRSSNQASSSLRQASYPLFILLVWSALCCLRVSKETDLRRPWSSDVLADPFSHTSRRVPAPGVNGGASEGLHSECGTLAVDTSSQILAQFDSRYGTLLTITPAVVKAFLKSICRTLTSARTSPVGRLSSLEDCTPKKVSLSRKDELRSQLCEPSGVWCWWTTSQSRRH